MCFLLNSYPHKNKSLTDSVTLLECSQAISQIQSRKTFFNKAHNHELTNFYINIVSFLCFGQQQHHFKSNIFFGPCKHFKAKVY